MKTDHKKSQSRILNLCLSKIIPGALSITCAVIPALFLTNCKAPEKTGSQAQSQVQSTLSDQNGSQSENSAGESSSDTSLPDSSGGSANGSSVSSANSQTNPNSGTNPASSSITSKSTASSSRSGSVASTSSSVPQSEETVLEYKKYLLETYMKPYWTGTIVYNETLMFVRDAQGNIAAAPLLYKPTEIIDVRSYDLTKQYQRGVDYNVVNGCIVLTPDTHIFKWAYETYYPETYKPNQSFGCTNGRYLLYMEGSTFTRRQIAVTYRHAGTWTGKKPEYQGSKIPKTIAKLKNKQPLKIVFNGDSITVGCNSSGWSGSLSEPKAPTWTDMLTEELKTKYNNSNITTVNTAVGGKTSTWGLENVDTLITQQNPDLVCLAFGMNDGALDKYAFKQNINGIINAVRKSHPDTEFVLVSTTLPNKEAAGFYLNQYQYESVLNEIAASVQGVAVAPVTSMHQYLLSKKRFYDMTANNINHPNDFLARMYAQTISKIMIENY